MAAGHLSENQIVAAHERRTAAQLKRLARHVEEISMTEPTPGNTREARGLDIVIVNHTGAVVRPVVMTTMDDERRVTGFEIRNADDVHPRIAIPSRLVLPFMEERDLAFRQIGAEVNSCFDAGCSVRAVLEQLDVIGASILSQEEKRLKRSLADLWIRRAVRPRDRMTADLAWALEVLPRTYFREDEEGHFIDRVLPAPPDDTSRWAALAWILFDLVKEEAGWVDEDLVRWLVKDGNQLTALNLLVDDRVSEKIFEVLEDA